jgi:membrane protein implicated in regulation of membrane protease activity
MEEIFARWLIIAGIFLVGELLVRTYYLLDFSAAAVISALSADLAFPFMVQWAIFFFMSLILIVFTREVKKET